MVQFKHFFLWMMFVGKKNRGRYYICYIILISLSFLPLAFSYRRVDVDSTKKCYVVSARFRRLFEECSTRYRILSNGTYQIFFWMCVGKKNRGSYCIWYIVLISLLFLPQKSILLTITIVNKLLITKYVPRKNPKKISLR